MIESGLSKVFLICYVTIYKLNILLMWISFYSTGYELEREAADNRAVVNRNDRPTFNHYSSKPQMYNANLPFHMHGLGMYPPPPPPPPPPPCPSGQYPYYQQPQQHPTHHHTAIPPQYPYWMMPQ